jgi:hypothetical protein
VSVGTVVKVPHPPDSSQSLVPVDAVDEVPPVSDVDVPQAPDWVHVSVSVA